MLSLFPGLLFLAPFAATILRLGVGICFLYVAYDLISRRTEIKGMRLPIVGHPSDWMVWVSGIIVGLDGLALCAGFGTQLAAIIGMIIAIKHLILSRKYASYLPFPRSTYILIFIICLTLLISGAGPLGYDLPL